MSQKTPNIGETVERWRHGVWVEDWVCMVRISHGPDPQDAELGVMVWGTDYHRHAPGVDKWRPKQ